MAAIQRLVVFNALLDLVNNKYQLATKHTDNSILLLISAWNEKKGRKKGDKPLELGTVQ